MPVFQTGQPIETDQPFIAVENRLPPGRHTFQLVVVDDGGNRSDPARAVVIVKAPLPPPPTGPTGPGRVPRRPFPPDIVVERPSPFPRPIPRRPV